MPAPWYREGVRFGCTRCGNCCTGAAGTVRVSDDEIGGLALALSLPAPEVRRRHTRSVRGGDVALVERQNGDCTFWSPLDGCTVYRARPRQCRSWPFWRAVVHSEARWNEAARDCPGMNQGAHHDARSIEALASDDGTCGTLPAG